MPQLDWDATIDSIKQSLPKAQFQNWVKPLKLIHCDDEKVVVGVPNRFHQDWVRTNYTNKLNEAIRHQCGSDLQLEFELVSESSRTNTPEDESQSGLQKGRPNLRVVDSNAENPEENSQAGVLAQLGRVQSESSPQAFVNVPAPTAEPPSKLPQFNDPFFEFGYNHLAYQCAQLFIQGSNPAINPLIIQGGVGMGKTHLLAEIGEQIQRNAPETRVRYVDFEAFTAEMVQSFKNNSAHEFKAKYRDRTDVLLFDNVQGLENRMRTQEELLHIFNELLGSGRRIAFTISTEPHRLEKFIPTLKSRLLSGVLAEIRPPSYEERVEVLTKKCQFDRIEMEEELLRSLASKGQKDIRELIGSLIQLHLQAKLENRVVDKEFLGQKSWVQESRKESVTIEEIITLVENNFGVSREDLISKSRKSQISWARQVAMYLARQYTLLSLEQIGKMFERDHATVIHAFTKVKDTMEKHPHRRFEVEFVKKKLASRTGQESNV